MSTQHFSCNDAKNLDMVNYLSSIGFQPEKVIHDDYWYLSPLREEKTASFKVNRKKNLWYDFGTGEGGTIIDFGIRFHHCTISEFLDKLKDSFSFHQPGYSHQTLAAGQKKKTLEVIAAGSITNPALCRYLNDRNISLELANKYCKEVHYSFNNKPYFAVGFPNNSGGYELRNSCFKGCIAPKDVTIFRRENAKEIAVFEGFFSFLSYLVFKETNPSLLPNLQADFLILDSLSLFKKSRDIMEKHEHIHLFLDLDKAGSKATMMALNWDKRYCDKRSFYQGYKDFNDMLIHRTMNYNINQERKYQGHRIF